MKMYKHHLVPRHAGGSDDPSNIVKVNAAMHSFLHLQRYKESGDMYDYIASRCISGRIGKDEAVEQARKEGLKRWREENKEYYTQLQSDKGKLGIKTMQEHPNTIAARKISTPAKRAAALKGSQAAVEVCGHKITIDGIEYPSLRAASKATGICRMKLAKLRQDGETDE